MALRRGSVNRWFNVESEELLTLHDELEQWRLDISQPLQLDIFVDAADEPIIRSALGMQVRALPRPSRARDAHAVRAIHRRNAPRRSPRVARQADEPTTVLLERWRIRYEPLGSSVSSISWPACAPPHRAPPRRHALARTRAPFFTARARAPDSREDAPRPRAATVNPGRYCGRRDNNNLVSDGAHSVLRVPT